MMDVREFGDVWSARRHMTSKGAFRIEGDLFVRICNVTEQHACFILFLSLSVFLCLKVFLRVRCTLWPGEEPTEKELTLYTKQKTIRYTIIDRTLSDLKSAVRCCCLISHQVTMILMPCQMKRTQKWRIWTYLDRWQTCCGIRLATACSHLIGHQDASGDHSFPCSLRAASQGLRIARRRWTRLGKVITEVLVLPSCCLPSAVAGQGRQGRQGHSVTGAVSESMRSKRSKVTGRRGKERYHRRGVSGWLCPGQTRMFQPCIALKNA